MEGSARIALCSTAKQFAWRAKAQSPRAHPPAQRFACSTRACIGVEAWPMGGEDELEKLRNQVASLRAAAAALLKLLEQIAAIKDDKERGEAFLKAMRSQPLFAVPRKK